MSQTVVSVVRYEKPLESVRQAVDLAGGLNHIRPGAKVFIKPNIVFWTKAVAFPKWGVVTTSRVVADMVMLLKEQGVDDITIGEGVVVADPKDKETPAHAFEALGYNTLANRYGVKVVNTFDCGFEKVDLGDGMALNFSSQVVNSDYIVDLPVLKAHNQTVVSLGIKNLKGVIDIPSRKRCHSADPQRNLHVWVSRLADKLPPTFTVIDGIYTLERGPGFDGKMRRSNLLVASADILSADLVGSRLLGHDPADVPYLSQAAANRNRPTDLSDVKVVGEKIGDLASPHEYDFPYSETEDGVMPVPLAKDGIKGLFYRKYDLSMCTYCSGLNGLLLSAIRYAWKGKPWDKVEVLTGKMMQPTPGMKKTILMGKCMVKANKDHPDIQEAIPIKGCPPKAEDILKALQQAGIQADPNMFAHVDQLPGFFMARYAGKPEFDETFFSIE